jgi:DNA-directed RNA polymerase subunit delta
VIKRRVIVDYKNVPDEVLQELSTKYPHGFGKEIIKFNNAKGELVTAVPLEVNDTSYLVKVSTQLQTMVDNYDIEDEFNDLVPAELDVDMDDVAKREKAGFEDEEEEDEKEDSYGDMEDFDEVADDEGEDD